MVLQVSLHCAISPFICTLFVLHATYYSCISITFAMADLHSPPRPESPRPAAPASPHQRPFEFPQLSPDQWDHINDEIRMALQPLHHELASNHALPDQVGDDLITILQEYFNSSGLFSSNSSKSNTAFKRRTSKTLQEAKRLKNSLRKTAFHANASREDRSKFYDALHAYTFLKKKQSDNDQQRSTKYEESRFRKDFWSFSRKVVNNELYHQDSDPAFTKDLADEYYTSRYASSPPAIDVDALGWMGGPPEAACPFDMSPVKPKDIKNILRNRSSRSAPGPDGISYAIIKKLPSVHHILATLYSKLLTNPITPKSWSCANVILIHKKDSVDNPSNFRMIALSSVFGKNVSPDSRHSP